MNASDFYTVKVKNGAGWRAYDQARLQISVGQEYHEGEKLLATLQWAAERFEKVIICVNDTLQRHNFEFEGQTPAQAFATAEAAGRQWIERNFSLISRVPRREIIRWEEWRTDPAYAAGLEIMNRLYDENRNFRTDVENEAESFWTRALKRDQAPAAERHDDFKRHSTAYLLEECAVFQLMFARDRAVDIYPGSTLLPCKLGTAQDLGSRGYTRIDFRRKAA